jgi:NTP pyrophosphatase (non-canonical NTP hydrolase)
MRKDDAVDIAYNAENMTLEQLLEAYAKFQVLVVNTPNHMADWTDMVHMAQTEHCVHVSDDTPITGKAMGWQHALHGAIGLVTESSEILDAFKKEMYGKNKPLRPDNIREECGDVFFYLALVMRGMRELGHDMDLRAIIKDNVVKLANRYIDKLET